MDTEYSNSSRAILRKLCTEMVNEHISAVSLDSYYETTEHRETIEHLFSVQILAYQLGSQQRLLFSHKLLFDYIVSVLLIPENADEFVRYFSTDPTRTIYLIPSSRYYFTRLWLHNQVLFWQIFLYPVSSATERHLKLFSSFLPPRLIAEMARDVEELSPLIEAVGRQETQAYISIRALAKDGFVLTTERKFFV